MNELMAIVKKRYEDGEQDIYHFALSENPKHLPDLVTIAWWMENASATVERANKPRLDILKDHLNNRRTKSCSGEWFWCAEEVLLNDGYNPYAYADALKKCLDKCGNSYLLDPPELFFKTFANPTLASYALVGFDECEVA